MDLNSLICKRVQALIRLVNLQFLLIAFEDFKMYVQTFKGVVFVIVMLYL